MCIFLAENKSILRSSFIYIMVTLLHFVWSTLMIHVLDGDGLYLNWICKSLEGNDLYFVLDVLSSDDILAHLYSHVRMNPVKFKSRWPMHFCVFTMIVYLLAHRPSSDAVGQTGNRNHTFFNSVLIILHIHIQNPFIQTTKPQTPNCSW